MFVPKKGSTHQLSQLCYGLESWGGNWAEGIVAQVQFDQVDQFPECQMLHLVKKVNKVILIAKCLPLTHLNKERILSEFQKVT